MGMQNFRKMEFMLPPHHHHPPSPAIRNLRVQEFETEIYIET